MTRLTTQLINFNGGEISPLLDARIDLDFYPSTCKKILNYIPLPQGPLTRRNGFRYVATAASPARLWPFVFATGEAYIIEFGNGYAKFYQNGQQVSGIVSTPYNQNELFDLQFAQVADLLYIVHPNYPPANIKRTGGSVFSYSEVNFKFGPTLDENETSTTLRISNNVGNSTITSSSPIFNSGMVGGVWAISEPDGSIAGYIQWQPNTNIPTGFIRNGAYVYYSPSGGMSGNIPPTHTRGSVSDGGIVWDYVNGGTGYIKFENYISPTQFSGQVQLPLPAFALVRPTTYWNRGAWSRDQGFPRAITFYDQRAWYAGTAQQPQTLWASKTNTRYENFDTGRAFDDDSLVFTLSSNEVDTINWLAAKTVLLAGTKGGVFVAKSSSFDQIITPSNIQVKKNVSSSCSKLAPILINNTLFFTHRAERKLLGASYNFEQDSFVSEDFTIRAEHITDSGIADIEYQQEPHSIVWLVTNDGRLVGMTYEQTQKVAGWHQHNTNNIEAGGDLSAASFESVASIPTATTDELWVVTRRIIAGQVVRFIEVLEPDDRREYYVDAGVYLEANYPQGPVGGFDHLSGSRVSVLLTSSNSTGGQLAVTDDQTVSSTGEIMLPYPCSKIVVGIPYYSELETNRINIQINDGQNFSKPSNIFRVSARLLDTIGLSIGPSKTELSLVPFRRTFDLMDNSPPGSGTPRPTDYNITFDGRWNPDYSTIYVRQGQPLPSTIISLGVQLNANTR